MAGFTIQLVSPAGAETDALLQGLRARLELAWSEELPESLEEVEVLWVHAGPEEDAPRLGNTAAQLLRAWILGGGRVLLTGAPAAWLGPLGLESNPPELRSRTWQGPIRATDRLGIAPFLRHPLFERFPGGVYLRRPAGSCRLGGAVWSKGRRPVEGRLICVEKVFLAVQAETGVLAEYAPGNGRVLALGTHLVFDDPSPREDPFLEGRLRFAADLCEFLLFGELESGQAWPELGAAVHIERDAFDAPAWEAPVADALDADGVAQLQPIVIDEKEGDPFFDLAHASGSFALGHAAGVREIWQLPLRLFSNFELSDHRGRALGKSVDSMRLEAQAVDRRFDGLHERTQRCARGFSQRLTRDAGGGGEALSLRLGFRCDGRLLWPYPSGLVPPRVEIACEQRAVRVEEPVTGRAASIVFEAQPARLRVEAAERGGALCEVEFELEPGQSFAWRVDVELEAAAEPGPGATLGPGADGGAGAAALDALPEELQQAAAWARLAVDRCYFDIRPFAGPRARRVRGYVAGLDLSRPGWCDGRPGPAWIFARESYWICRATMADGAAARARACATLETLAAFQDPRGGIPHEITAAGLAHYDATDATPLFVDAVCRLLDLADDAELTRAFWPKIERALAWVFDCDRDGDGLLENGRGHGFVEDGPLRSNVHVELAVACAQYAGLNSASLLARELGHDVRASEWESAARHVRELLNARFLDTDSRGFAYGMLADGSFDRRLTAFAVLPVLFDVLEPEAAAQLLDVFDDASFSRAEGVRTIASADRDYDPLGYHRGAAWPFFGALLAWAELRCALVDRGRARLEALASSAGKYGLMPEIVDGETGAPIGVCRHHAAASAIFLAALRELQVALAEASAR